MPNEKEHDIMTLSEAAEFLRLGKRSIYKMAKAGKIPCKMVLNKWRFEREALRSWVRDSAA